MPLGFLTKGRILIQYRTKVNVRGGNVMENNYKHEIMELIETIDNNAFWHLVYKFIIAAKKKWGI